MLSDRPQKDQVVLEKIRAWPSTLSGRRNEVFASRLMGTNSVGNFTERENKREIESQMRVVLRSLY